MSAPSNKKLPSTGEFHPAHYFLLLPRLLNEEMHVEGRKAKSFRGIECKADYIQVGNDIWMEPFMTSS